MNSNQNQKITNPWIQKVFCNAGADGSGKHKGKFLIIDMSKSNVMCFHFLIIGYLIPLENTKKRLVLPKMEVWPHVCEV